MRYLILSDLHANLEATDSVLEDARMRGFDAVAVLGDIVGYGADPEAVIRRVRDLKPIAIVRGNHDKAVAGITEAESFNDVARSAVLWTRRVLSKDSLDYLHTLPCGPIDAGGFLISHGSPLDEEDYILSEGDARGVWEHLDFDAAFFGHSHFACVFFLDGDAVSLLMLQEDRAALRLEPSVRYLINPGSIGQPRDHDPRASYAIFDLASRTLESFRVEYDVTSAQAKIVEAGLPHVLGQRLSLGV